MEPVQRPLLSPSDGESFQDLSRRLTRERKNHHIADLPCGINALLNTLFCLTWPVCGCCCASVEQTQNYRAKIITRAGVITDIIREPGQYFFNPCCLEEREVSECSYRGDLESLKINDINGLPIYASAFYYYQVDHTLDSVYKLHEPERFIKDQARTVFLKVLSKYPYDRHPGERGDCLRYISPAINDELKYALQEQIGKAGWYVTQFNVSGIGVSDNIEKLTLARQIAQTYVTGKRTIAKGAMGILESTLISLRQRGFELTDHERDALLADLVYMICNNDNFTLNLNKIEQ